MQKITIEGAQNGFILTYPSESPEVRDTDTEVFQHTPAPVLGGCFESDTLKELFLRVAEVLGHQYDKFGDDNITILSRQLGHKREGAPPPVE